MRKLGASLASIMLALTVTSCSFDGSFRYECQDPANWDKDICQKPLCDVTRQCPEHVFKGGRDPRLGMPDDQKPATNSSAQQNTPTNLQGANCGK